MHLRLTPLLMAATLIGTGCSSTEEQAKVIEKKAVQVENGQFTPELMHMMGKVSDPQLSPDKSKILYGVSYTDIQENKSNRELFVMNVDGTGNTRLTRTPSSESNARWIDGGSRIMFARGGQIWTMNADGTGEKQVSDIQGGISEFKLSPDGKQLMYVSEIKSCIKPTDNYPDLDKSSGRTMTDLMYRHWDHFVETIPHTYVASFDGNTVGAGKDIIEGEPYELPTLPFGGLEQLSWSPDGKYIAYSCRKVTGKEYAFSTNTDIYLYEVASGKTVGNLSKGMMGYDTEPSFSPDGKKLAWISMERAGFEADKRRLFIYDMASGTRKDATADYKYNVDAVTWSDDSKSIYFNSCVNALTGLYNINLEDNSVRRITADDVRFDFSGVQVAGDRLIGTYMSMKMPSELVSVNIADGSFVQLSHENDDILAQLKDVNIEQRWMETTDGKQMHTWIVYPPDFNPEKKYPAILICLGGPQGTISQAWSTRWNYRLMASQGYIVILPNRRGTTAFGQEWTDAISGDYCGQCMKDYLTAVNNMKKEKYVGKVGAAGASFGGYSIYYLAGTHNGTFDAFLAHAGIFNQEQMYMMTEELWFPTWDNGGAPWDENPVAKRHYANSPHKLIKNWDTPIFITHGEMDYRVPVEQGMAAFNAAQMMGVESRMLLFPEENHWILRPQNSVHWNREFFAWFDKYLKK